MTTTHIAVVASQWWTRAAETLGYQVTSLSPSQRENGNTYARTAGTRLETGTQWLHQHSGTQCDFILDNGGAGFALTSPPQPDQPIQMFHETLNVPLASHLIDPLVTVFDSLQWNLVWPALQSRSWHKFIWDRPQCEELEQFGVPNVHHLPMAAVNRQYNTDRLNPNDVRQWVGFIGAQNTTCYYPERTLQPRELLASTIVQAAQTRQNSARFYDVYFNQYKLADPPTLQDDAETRMKKVINYYANKFYFNAAQCIRRRERFVLFLKQKLGDLFRIQGPRWDYVYGLKCDPPVPSQDEYLDQFRRTAINLNLVNGNAETGLNMRHFEITAAGGFMLCNHLPEVEECFEIGRECATFTDEQDLLEKIQFYLQRPHERMAIAKAGQERTLSRHLYSHRLDSVIQTLCMDRKNQKPVSQELHVV